MGKVERIMAQAAGKAVAVANSLASKVPVLIKGTKDFATPKLMTFWKYAKVEMKPPMPGEIGEIQAGFSRLMHGAKTGAWKKVTVKEATINTCIAAEICFWFFAGEIIGRRNIVGYYIPGAVNYEAHV